MRLLSGIATGAYAAPPSLQRRTFKGINKILKKQAK
jgi:hypothetical protein